MSDSSLVRSADFEGKVIPLHARGGEEWATCDIVADLLGYEGSRRSKANKVAKLYRTHRAEFLGSEVQHAFVGVEVGIQNPHLAAPRVQRHRKLIFSLSGIDHLAILSRTAAGIRVRRWCVDRMEAARRGDRVVTADQLGALRSHVEQRDALHAAEVSGLRAIIEALAKGQQIGLENNLATTKLLREVISHSGKLLAMAKLLPETEAERIERALDVEKRERANGQRFLTPPPGASLNRMEG